MICEVRSHPACAGRASHTHHRKLRSQGGTDDPVNLLRVCAICHHDIHARPGRAYAHGWLVKSWQDPAEVFITKRCVVCGEGPCDGEFCPSIPKEAA